MFDLLYLITEPLKIVIVALKYRFASGPSIYAMLSNCRMKNSP